MPLTRNSLSVILIKCVASRSFASMRWPYMVIAFLLQKEEKRWMSDHDTFHERRKSTLYQDPLFATYFRDFSKLITATETCCIAKFSSWNLGTFLFYDSMTKNDWKYQFLPILDFANVHQKSDTGCSFVIYFWDISELMSATEADCNQTLHTYD